MAAGIAPGRGVIAMFGTASPVHDLRERGQ